MVGAVLLLGYHKETKGEWWLSSTPLRVEWRPFKKKRQTSSGEENNIKHTEMKRKGATRLKSSLAGFTSPDPHVAVRKEHTTTDTTRAMLGAPSEERTAFLLSYGFQAASWPQIVIKPDQKNMRNMLWCLAGRTNWVFGINYLMQTLFLRRRSLPQSMELWSG